MAFYRYSRWDGSQEIFPLDGDELMEQISESLMGQGDIASALRSLAQRGIQGRQGQRLTGIQELLQRLRERRQGLLDQYDPGSTLAEIKERLDDLLDTEREGIARRLQEVRQRHQQGEGVSELPEGTPEQLQQILKRMAEQNLEFLDQLPQNPVHAIQRLSSHEFMDDSAREKFQELIVSLQRGVLDSHLRDLFQHLQHLEPQGKGRLKEMFHDLNALMAEKLEGDQPSFQEFMQRHGQLFGPNPPNSLDELIEQMQQQMAQMDSLLRSMTSEQRQEIQGLLQAAFDDEDLQAELAQLASHLDQLDPLHSLSREYPFQGDDPLTLQEAMELMEHLQGMEEVEKQLKRTQRGGNLTEVDTGILQQVLGAEAAQEMERLTSLAEVLEEAGYIRQVGRRHELTPKGTRKIGQRALQEIFAHIKRDRAGSHDVRYNGGGGELQESTKRYEYGDPFNLHINRTIMNAIQRDSAGVPVRVQQEDFEVYRQEQLAQCTTVLMLDLSLSMAMRGNFLAAKKVTLALDNLIHTQFPRDTLYVVGFSTYAREVKPDGLPYLNWDEFDPYTNIQHGLAVARRLFARTSGGSKQIIMISDGEPTAHIEDGQLFLQYPPSSRTIRETLLEVKRCTGRGIVINTFMLDHNSYLSEFVEQMTRLNRGRVFYTSREHLGHYILVDYVSSRRHTLF